MKQLFIILFILSISNNLFAQDIIYTVSGEYNQNKTPIDSIVVENWTNNTSMSFGDLPEHDYYQINLTQNAFWGTVSVFDIKEAPIFTIQQNTPGLLSVLFNYTKTSDARISIININGQIMYSRKNVALNPNNILQVKLGSEGVYFVKIESPKATQIFKSIGSPHVASFDVGVSDGLGTKSVQSELKSSLIVSEGDFTFEDGDSIRVWAFRKDIHAWPKSLRIQDSDDINLQFNEIAYRTEMLKAYPDSVGEEILFIYERDTLFFEKINGEYIHQGDIIFTAEQLEFDSTKGAWINRNWDLDFRSWEFSAKKVNFWPKGKVYYFINRESFSDKDIEKINNAIYYWHSNTALSFIERSGENANQENYIEFVWDEKSIASEIGMKKGGQIIKIISDPESGDVIHEIGHAIGLLHEQSRSDRDESITVFTENILEEKRHNYKKYRKSKNEGPFDWNSIMLYSSDREWAINKDKPVMLTTDGLDIITQNSYLSMGDIKTVDEIYGLKASKRPKVAISDKYNPEDFSYTVTGEILEEGERAIIERGVGIRKEGDTKIEYFLIDTELKTFSKIFNDLIEDGVYYFLSYATNYYGKSTSEITEYQHIRYTKPEAITIAFDSITESSVKLVGEIEKVGGSQIEEYGFYWGSNPEPTDSDSIILIDTDETLKILGGNFETTLTNLEPNTTYYFRAFATNFIGTAVGDTVSFTTLEESKIETGTITDSRDNKTYKTVKIGEQWWMAENLAYLPSINSYSDKSSTKPNYFVYKYSISSDLNVIEAKTTDNYVTYGVLYNWPAAKAACSPGWHLPTDDEWKQLEMAIGMSQSEADSDGYRGTNEGTKLKAISGWRNNGNGTDEFGFSALPGGFRYGGGSFQHKGYFAILWSATEYSEKEAWSRILCYDYRTVKRSNSIKEHAMSIRCVKN